MPGADRRLIDLVSGLPRYRSKEITAGRVALKSTTPAAGRLPGVVGRAELINQFNARAVPIASEDVTDPARLPGKFIPSFRPLPNPNRATSAATRSSRGSRPPSGSTSGSSSTGKTPSIELDDNETVAAGIMLTMTAADLYAPSAARIDDRIRQWRIPGLAR